MCYNHERPTKVWWGVHLFMGVVQMDFAELLASYLIDGAELPEDYLAQLGTAHDTAMSGAGAAVTEVEAALAAALEANTALQAHNYRLMMQISAEPGDGGGNGGDGGGDGGGGGGDDDDISGDADLTDALFQDAE